MPFEIEAKLRVDNLQELQEKLSRVGAANEGACLERNWVLDDAEGSLAKRNLLLRVRSMGGVEGILTVKRPVQSGEFKTREEIESMVDSTEDLLKQLAIVGFTVQWIYEKYRQTWLWRDCVLALDECPEIGTFVEIEGLPNKIREIARELGLDPEEHIQDNYLRLWQKHLDARGEAKRNMVFTDRDPHTRFHPMPSKQEELPAQTGADHTEREK